MQVSTKLQVASFLLKELRNYNRQLFLYLSQKLAKTQPAFWTTYFMINLHFGVSNYLPTCRKMNLLLINSVYLVFSSLKNQRRFFSPAMFLLFWKNWFARSSNSFFYFQNSLMFIPAFQNETLYVMKLSYTCNFSFWCSFFHIFLYKWIFFKKLKTSFGAYFF